MPSFLFEQQFVSCFVLIIDQSVFLLSLFLDVMHEGFFRG